MADTKQYKIIFQDCLTKQQTPIEIQSLEQLYELLPDYIEMAKSLIQDSKINQEDLCILMQFGVMNINDVPIKNNIPLS